MARTIKRLRSIPTLSQLYQRSAIPLVSPRAGVAGGGDQEGHTTTYLPSHALNSRISLLQHDITALNVSHIVNAANTSLLGGGGVDGAIHCAAGPRLLAECHTLGGCETGSAKITRAGDLPVKKVVHAVGPIYPTSSRARGRPRGDVQGGREEERAKVLLSGCYRTSLELVRDDVDDVEEWGVDGGGEKSVAFPCISTGVYRYPLLEAATVAAKEVRRFLEEQEHEHEHEHEHEQEKKDGKRGKVDRVIFCCFGDKDVQAYEAVLPIVFPPAPEDLSPPS